MLCMEPSFDKGTVSSGDLNQRNCNVQYLNNTVYENQKAQYSSYRICWLLNIYSCIFLNAKPMIGSCSSSRQRAIDPRDSRLTGKWLQHLRLTTLSPSIDGTPSRTTLRLTLNVDIVFIWSLEELHSCMMSRLEKSWNWARCAFLNI